MCVGVARITDRNELFLENVVVVHIIRLPSLNSKTNTPMKRISHVRSGDGK